MVGLRRGRREQATLSRLADRALVLRRRFPGVRGLLVFTLISVVASWALSSLTYLVLDPGMFTSVLGQVLPIVTPIAVAAPIYWVLFTLVDDLDAEIARRVQFESVLQVFAGQDDLTGLANRRTLIAELGSRLSTGQVVAVAMFDLDHFKKVNDEHGHAVGDQALVAVARAATTAVGAQGLVSRLGGEEFAVVVYPGEDVLEELLARVLEFVRDAGAHVGTTASIGATLVRPDDTVDSALLRADELLYRAKETGRDRVVMDPECEDAASEDSTEDSATEPA